MARFVYFRDGVAWQVLDTGSSPGTNVCMVIDTDREAKENKMAAKLCELLNTEDHYQKHVADAVSKP